ncbi:MAG: hypothetical protein IKR84_07880, partial [Oscillibacter sp.]|nr:hypothetical protein [Oscillibacter sp.]
ELLLFALYAEHGGAMGLDDATAAYLLKAAFRRLQEIDVHSEKVVKEIHNASVYANALTLLENADPLAASLVDTGEAFFLPAMRRRHREAAIARGGFDK